MNRARTVSFLGCLSFLLSLAANADDLGVAGRKLIILDKITAAQKAKTVFVSKGDDGIEKGAAGDPAQLAGSFEWSYLTDEPQAVSGFFGMPSSNWTVNTEAVAKFVNTEAFTGSPTFTKVVVIKPSKVAKFVARGLADEGTPNLLLGPPSDSGGITTVLTITNGNDSSTHRMCTRFAVDDGSKVIYKEIAQGTGRKIAAALGVPSTCPASPSAAFLD